MKKIPILTDSIDGAKGGVVWSKKFMMRGLNNRANLYFRNSGEFIIFEA